MTPTKAYRLSHRQSAASPSSPPHLTYYGGPVVSNPAVESVLWGAGTYLPEVTGSTTPNMDTFFGHVTNSAYTAWLGEYDTTTQSGPRSNQVIGAGHFVGRKTITPSAAANGTTVDDTANQKELLDQVDFSTRWTPASSLPRPSTRRATSTRSTRCSFAPA
jgi:hypothetical protein